MPWVCANCHANNSLSHTTCDVCGSEQRLRFELTAPIETVSIADETPIDTESTPSPSYRIITKSGIIAASITCVLCFLALIYLTPTTDDIPIAPVFVPLILATLMYGRVIALVSLPWFTFLLLIVISQQPPLHMVMSIALLPIAVVFGTWYTASRECASEITTHTLTKAAMVGVTVGTILNAIIIEDWTWGMIALVLNLIMMFIVTPIWWRIMRKIYSNPDVLVMRHLKERERMSAS
jgi:hypothetical protein